MNLAEIPTSDQPPRGQQTLSEIVSQPDCWAAAYAYLTAQADSLTAAWARVSPQRVIVTGCGSSYYASQTVATLLQSLTGLPAQGVPASEIALYPDGVLHRPEETLLIALSRSGTTSETAAALDKFRSRGGKALWGITCHAGTPIAEGSDLTLLADMAQEQAVAQTRSLTTLLLLAQGIAALAGGQELTPLGRVAEAGRRLIAATYGMALQWGVEAGKEHFFFLGAGHRYGLAREAVLKFQEISCTHAAAYHTLEFRHGPKTLVDEQTMVVGLLGAEQLAQEAAVIQEVAAMGATTLTLIPGKPNAGHVTVHLPADLPAWTMPVLYLPLVQIMAHARALHKGLDPDRPRNLPPVVHLDRDSLR